MSDQAPAVPVVHPEPGDREQRWIETFSIQANEWDGDKVWVEDATAPLIALADVEVAAAVAAVRADLADQIEERADGWRRVPPHPNSPAGVKHAAAKAAWLAAAAIVRGES